MTTANSTAKMKTIENTFKKETLEDPLETFEDIKKWSVCGNILIHLENFNYLIECIICKHRFCHNDVFIKHVHENHSDIFSADLKQEFEATNTSLADDLPYYVNPVFENELHINELDINTNDCKEISLNKVEDIKKASQLECKNSSKSIKLNTKKNKRDSKSPSPSLKNLKGQKTIRPNKIKKTIKVKEEKICIQEKCNLNENDGIPEILRKKTNGLYQCSKCSSKFKQYHTVRDHFWLKHTFQFKLDDEKCVPNIPENFPNPDDNLFHCTACLGRYANYEGLLMHFKYHPGAKMIEKKPHKCSSCNTTCWTMFLLKAHEVVHTRERPFVCEICSRGFIRKENLASHVRTHNDDRRYKCNYCVKRFFTNFQRTTHELIHSNSKPHVCEICGVAYRLRFKLTMHMRRHTGERKAKCNICDKSFYDNRNLVEHMRIHTGEKKFKCEVCQKGFIRKTHLKTHEKLHSEDKSYICEICNQGFKQNAGLYSHMKCVHGTIKLATAEIE